MRGRSKPPPVYGLSPQLFVFGEMSTCDDVAGRIGPQFSVEAFWIGKKLVEDFIAQFHETAIHRSPIRANVERGGQCVWIGNT